MISPRSIERYFTRFPSLSGLIYLALIIALCLTAVLMLTDIVEQYRARNASLELLSQLNGRSHFSSAKHDAETDSWPPGSPFLEGQTVTVASAALLQRITSIISRAGGTVVSSEMEQPEARSKDGYLTAVANCELAPEALQRVLYDMEAGLPFLFIDQLVVQAPTAPGESGRLRVRLGVAGLWTGGT